MNKITTLDCTLRDGGYCNQWRFGFRNTKKIIQSLMEAGIDIIECGFLTNRVAFDPDVTKFTTVEEMRPVIPTDKAGRFFVAMMNYGEYNVDELPVCDGTSIDGIRVAFHKKDRREALELCAKIKEKGYLVFVQAMVSLAYSDEEFLGMIRCVNDIKPYAFYIVDSFGMMKKKNLMRLFYMVENNLDENIWIGFHSHNNMQLAYSNAQSLVDARTSRNLIIDVSVYGMGRGAGNLNTELFVEYLNENAGGHYALKPLLNVIDEILNEFYQKNYWGYSLPNYLSAAHNLHPNYAGYLADKNTLTAEAMEEIFSMMNSEKKVSFDKAYAEQMYLQYMAAGKNREEHRRELEEQIQGKKVLLIAPGRSSVEEKEKIVQTAGEADVIVISINFEYSHCDTNFIFLSNLRRFRELEPEKRSKCIVTSNVPADNAYLQTRYYDLLCPIDAVRDNAGMMAIRFLIDLGVREVYLAGFDGYSHEAQENYASQQMVLVTKNAVAEAMNKGMGEMLEKFAKLIDLRFLTTPKHVKFGNLVKGE